MVPAPVPEVTGSCFAYQLWSPITAVAPCSDPYPSTEVVATVWVSSPGLWAMGYGLCTSVRVILCRPRPTPLPYRYTYLWRLFEILSTVASNDGYGRLLSVLIHSVPRDYPVLGSPMFVC